MKLFNAVIAAAVASGKRLEIFTGQNLGQNVINPDQNVINPDLTRDFTYLERILTS